MLIGPCGSMLCSNWCFRWDWNIVASWDDGASWPLWQPGERAPYECGEGGGGQGIGSSLYQIMFHHSNWFVSADGGHNYKIGDAPGGGSGFDYVRQAGSRTEPTGTWFYQIEAPATWEPGSATAKDAPPVPGGAVTSKPRGDAKAHAAEKARIQVQGNGMPTTTATQNASALAAPPPPSAYVTSFLPGSLVPLRRTRCLVTAMLRALMGRPLFCRSPVLLGLLFVFGREPRL